MCVDMCICVCIFVCVCVCEGTPLRIQIGLVWPRCDVGTFLIAREGRRDARWRKGKQWEVRGKSCVAH